MKFHLTHVCTFGEGLAKDNALGTLETMTGASGPHNPFIEFLSTNNFVRVWYITTVTASLNMFNRIKL